MIDASIDATTDTATDTAAILTQLIREESPKACERFLSLELSQQEELLFLLEPQIQESLLLELARKKQIQSSIENMKPDDLVDLFQNMGIDAKHEIWNALSEEAKKVTKYLLAFDYDDAGGIMTPQYVEATPSTTVKKTIEIIRTNIDEVETIYYIYVVDRVGKLMGIASLRDLMRRKDDTTLEEFMTCDYHYVNQYTDQEDTARLLKEHDLLAIPVLDKYHRLLGIVTIDDAVQIIEEEYEQDILHISAIQSEPGSKSYLNRSFLKHFQSRVPWLILLLLASTFTSNVINWFSSFISSSTFLVLFIPVITSTGGNTAVQSSALIIRGLAKNELSFKDLLQIVSKELLVALALGICLGTLIVILGIYVPPIIPLNEGIALGISLLFIVLFSAIFGIFAPLVISRFGFDPTVIASPLIATIIDIVGLSLYFSIARFVLKI